MQVTQSVSKNSQAMQNGEIMPAFAHSGPGPAGAGWHRLEEHLYSVASQSRNAADAWSGGEIASLAGLWHDLGQYAPDWQQFLQEVGEDASSTDERFGADQA